MKIHFALLGVVATFAIAGAQAQPADIRPGLWEQTYEVSGMEAQMEQAIEQLRAELENMPPERREMVEGMMAEQGIDLDNPSLMGGTIQVCLAEEDIVQGDFVQDGECDNEVLERSDERMHMRFSCQGNPPSEGEAEVNFLSNTHFTTRAQMRMQVEGQVQEVTVEQEAEWLGEDCDDVG